MVIALSFSQVLWASESQDPPLPTPCELTLVGLKTISNLPIVTYQAGETPLTEGSRTGLLLILKNGSVAIVKNGIEMAKVSEPGAVFGELSALLDKPHTADVRALETTQFYVANADTLLRRNPVAMGYVATILAGRLDGANETLVELKTQVQGGEPRQAIANTVEKLEKRLQGTGDR
jgi:CRP/FNR family cyclic AMP-dependent transcriptional regulator